MRGRKKKSHEEKIEYRVKEISIWQMEDRFPLYTGIGRKKSRCHTLLSSKGSEEEE